MRRLCLFSFALFAVIVIAPVKAKAEQSARRVAVELMIAVDVSHSIDSDELSFQVESIAKAFRDDRLIRKIVGLHEGGIAVAVMFWAGKDEQLTIVPWRLIDNRASALSFADTLVRRGKSPWSGLLFTALGNALSHAFAAFGTNGFEGNRKVIDVSSDDPHNQGISLKAIRQQVIDAGITINGLPILSGRDEHEERKHLIDYYRDQVIGGFGAFMVPALSNADYAKAMLRKLILEIAGLEQFSINDLCLPPTYEMPPSPASSVVNANMSGLSVRGSSTSVVISSL